MALTSDEMQKIKLESLGGVEASNKFDVAFDALHAFAQASGALVGTSVVQWFELKLQEYQENMTKAIRESHDDSRRE